MLSIRSSADAFSSEFMMIQSETFVQTGVTCVILSSIVGLVIMITEIKRKVNSKKFKKEY